MQSLFVIQIQHLLKLNYAVVNSGVGIFTIQIQLLLKLNLISIIDVNDHSAFKYNSC